MFMSQFKITINYKTQWEESLYLYRYSTLEEKNTNVEELSMACEHEEHWSILVNVTSNQPFYYHFGVKRNTQIVREEVSSRIFPISTLHNDTVSDIKFEDDWNDLHIPIHTFQNPIFKSMGIEHLNQEADNIYKETDTHLFIVQTHLLAPGKKIGILGNCNELNNWDLGRPILLNRKDLYWELKLCLEHAPQSIQYKFVVIDEDSNEIIAFEKGNNRILEGVTGFDGLIVKQLFVDFQVFAWRATGLNVPLSGLRSNEDWGVGDFSSLAKYIEWAKASGFKMIQLLPINDTMSLNGIRDSYPYSAVSAFAVHPIYLNVAKVASEFKIDIDKTILHQASTLNELPTLDYVAVLDLKLKELKKIFSFVITNKSLVQTLEVFANQHRDWLLPYAAFSVLRDEFGTADHSKWTSFERYSETVLDSVWKKDLVLRSKMMFYIFLQFQLELQINEVKRIAAQNDIILKGDLPIGVGRFSVETWTRPTLFHLNQQAGAPPDAFTKKGQNWFFPTYNWEEMEKDNYAWWKARLKQLNRFFDAIRIDHILGFFRIWSIPLHAVEGLLGRFVPAHPLLKNDIVSWGLETSPDKLFHPHISDNILKSHFSDRWETVKSVFFDDNQFKPTFRTQTGITHFIDQNPVFSADEPSLFELLSDLIFLDDESVDGAYHFRINMMDTESYKGLSWNDQLILREHYYDYFYRKQDPDWKTGGSKKLDAIQHASSMLICAEDLGMVPDFVEGVLQAREMLTLQVQRMPKKMGAAFSLTIDANYLSVVTPSTHDMSPIRNWWMEDEEQKQKFYKEIMHGIGDVPHDCSEEIVRWIVKDHLHAHSMWCVFLLQDILSCNQKFWRRNMELDRINNPADPYHYWNFRSHIAIETLMLETDFSNLLINYFKESNRIMPSNFH